MLSIRRRRFIDIALSIYGSLDDPNGCCRALGRRVKASMLAGVWSTFSAVRGGFSIYEAGCQVCLAVRPHCLQYEYRVTDILLCMQNSDKSVTVSKLSRSYKYGLVGILIAMAASLGGEPVVGDLLDWPLRADVWGTVGQWVGSLLTGISFYLAYRVYKSSEDRERRAQAALVTFDCKITNNRYRGTVYNHSKSMISHVYLIVSQNASEDMNRKKPSFSKVRALTLGEKDNLDKKEPASFIAPISETEYTSVRPGVEHPFDEAAMQIGPSGLYNAKLMFTDGAGVDWIRYHDNGRLEER